MNDFEKVKSALNLTEVIAGSTNLRMKNKHLEECPFCHGHECFSIDDTKQLYKCFQCPDPGGGDVFTFIKTFFSLDDRAALKKGAELAGIHLKSQPKKRLSTVDKIYLESADYYHNYMLNNGAKKYLTEKRGHKIETLKRLLVGYSDGNLHTHLRHKKFSNEEILDSGLVRKKEVNGKPVFYDYFVKDLVIYPHFSNNRVLHFTIKDPKKKRKYQLPHNNRNNAWLFYNQDALYHHKEIIFVEGENDLQSIMDAGFYNTIAQIGQISDIQIKALNKYCRKKKLILWLDNDNPNKKTGKQPGHAYIRKICKTLTDIDLKIIIYPDNTDPDEYLQKFNGDRRQEIQHLISESLDYISWEIHQAGKLPDLEKKLKTLKDHEIFNRISMLSEIKRQVYLEKLVFIGFSEKGAAELIADSIGLRKKLELYFMGLAKKVDADPIYIANVIYDYISEKGKFYKTIDKKVFLLFEDDTYEISNNLPFNSLMMVLSDLLPTKEPGRSVWVALANKAYAVGVQIHMTSWIHTDKDKDAIFLNLNSPNNQIIKICAKEITEIPNGINDENIFLKSSTNIQPFNYLPDAKPAEAFSEIKRLIFDNLTCEKEQRYLIICWAISAFLIDYVNTQALMKFAGASKSGKTTGAKLLSILIYGREEVGSPTAAAAFAQASQNPMLLIDNLESTDITNAMKDFLLLSASRSNKVKRTSGTESDTTQERPKALVLVTAIEPFTLPEMINRTMELEFNRKFKIDDFIEDEITRELIKKRDMILSGIIKFIAKQVIPNLSDRRAYISILQKEYRGHAKSRNNEYLALLMVILNQLLPHIPYFEKDHFMDGIDHGEKDIRHAWIEYQNSRARENEAGSNDILKMFDGIVYEYIQRIKDIDLKPEPVYEYDDEVYIYNHPDYGLTLIKEKPKTLTDDRGEPYTSTKIEFIASAQEIVRAFDAYCKNKGLKNPYKNASVFGKRLENDLSILRKQSWDLESKPSIYPHFRIIHGKRFYKFVHFYHI